jgi:HEAT repeat protein
VRAAEALGRIGTAANTAFPALVRAATADDYALVREAAMRSLGRVNREKAEPIWRERAEKDPETGLQALAKDLLSHDPAK